MSTLATLFPTLLALYLSVALWVAQGIARSYDRVPDNAFHGLTLPARVGVLVGFAATWPLSILAVVVLMTAATVRRRGA